MITAWGWVPSGPSRASPARERGRYAFATGPAPPCYDLSIGPGGRRLRTSTSRRNVVRRGTVRNDEDRRGAAVLRPQNPTVAIPGQLSGGFNLGGREAMPVGRLPGRIFEDREVDEARRREATQRLLNV
jgi:hypothetical protein